MDKKNVKQEDAKSDGVKAKEVKSENAQHDGLFKELIARPEIAREFVEHYVEPSFAGLLDLSTIKLEKDSFVEKNLRLKFSDIVLSVKTKTGDKAFVYSLIEQQSSVDNRIAFRLWKYALLLAERHLSKSGKLPLIAPIVVYSGSRKYSAPRNLWDLFVDPAKAKELLGGNYRLVDLQAMPDDEIARKKISVCLSTC